MSDYIDLEIGLYRRDEAGQYAVELRLSQPEPGTLDLARGIFRLDDAALRTLELDPRAYGLELLKQLLVDADVLVLFKKARTLAESQNQDLRVRLVIGPGALELHALRWECLGELALNQRIFFSRYLSSRDNRPVSLRRQGQLRALVVVANPSDLSRYQPDGQPLAPIDVAGELERARNNLGEQIPVDALTEPGSGTLAAIADRLAGGYDILYLVAHGVRMGRRKAAASREPAAPDEGEDLVTRSQAPRLVLESPDPDKAGQAEFVAGADLAERLAGLRQPPRLVVLATCQSGTGDLGEAQAGTALAAIGPQLAGAGIPAVIAMQGNVTMATIELLMPVLFRELQTHGEIDRALAVARGAVQDRSDWWMPVVYMRLSDGRLWYTPGFAGDEGQSRVSWDQIVRHIQGMETNGVHRSKCTAILGPGTYEHLVGSREELARGWADSYGYPLSPDERDSLPQVAQFLKVKKDAEFAKSEFMAYLRRMLRQNFGAQLQDLPPQTTVNALLARLWQTHFATGEGAREPNEPLALLARQPFTCLITTDPTDALLEALRAAGKTPHVAAYEWKRFRDDLYDDEEFERYDALFAPDPDLTPTVNEPLVYHLYGHLSLPDSLVLTEDDYFDYLISFARNRNDRHSGRFPKFLLRPLTDAALLFLGFRMNDWAFRICLRSLLSRGEQESGRLHKYSHVSAQVNPVEGPFLNPEGARQYLQAYFDAQPDFMQRARLNVYWGSAADFVEDLEAAWAERDRTYDPRV